MWTQTMLIWLISSALLGGLFGYLTIVAYRKWSVQRRFRRGKQAEKQAVAFLRHRGYRILAAQLQETIVVYVDGEPQKSTVRADFLVRKGWKTYIVEVKSGQQGTVRLPNVRRQLLEYQLVYRPSGMLLLDMERRQLQEIRFGYIRKWQWKAWYIILGSIFFAGGMYVFLQQV